MKVLTEKTALERLRKLKDNFRSDIAAKFEHRAKSCLTCETKGACCVDAHFVNVHISRLEAVAIREVIEAFPTELRARVRSRIDNAIVDYSLSAEGDTYSQTFACPLFEKGVGCLVHSQGKPLACITHACYENEADLPPGHMLAEQEGLVDELNTRTYGRPQRWLPLPLAIR